MQDIMERIEPRMMAIILGATVLLITVALISFLLWPQFREYRSIENTHTLLGNMVTDGGELAKELITAKNDVASLDRDLHGDMANLPVKQLESYIIGKLQKISWQADLELVSVKPGKGKMVRNFREILFEVEVVGSYFNFFEWLRTVGKELGFVVIKRFDISPQTRYEPEPALNVKLTMVSYRAAQ